MVRSSQSVAPLWVDTRVWPAWLAVCLTTDVSEQSSASPSASAALGSSDAKQQIEQLFAKLEKPLTNVLYRKLWDREEVRDVVQEAFLRLWRVREQIDWQRVDSLVYKIALNLAQSRLRKRKVWRWIGLDQTPPATILSPESDTPSPEHPDKHNTRQHRAEAAIQTLSEKHRRVLLLTTFSAMTYAQIGETLGISAGTVASRRNAAVTKLRAVLEKEDFDER